ncbi:MAG TPA: ZIP family metal transporter [Bryobacteraceae bacterium]|nr:ZIP family metal transporter [Bryobacteraceae bacterium]
MTLLALVTVYALAIAGVFAGTRLAEAPKFSRTVLALSGALLIAISLFWVVPEVARRWSWPLAILWVTLGTAILAVIDRVVYPICPSCSHDHDHAAWTTHLHGFAPPLLIASGLHSFLDGWGIAASGEASDVVRVAVFLGIALHKIPEGLALGAILRASMSSHTKSLAACIAVEGLTVVGGLLAVALTTYVSGQATALLLAFAAGIFIYLGYHALEAELHRRLVARNRIS